ncbi:MAG: cell division protein FtsA, partial [Candidatus Colwellbacteria bacterium]|nr:cell division protein FtsA [Candidatus Colwellbacteria bacterium]
MANLITGLDIGTHATKVAVGEVRRDGTITLLLLTKLPSSGMRRGVVIDVGDATKALSPLLARAKAAAKAAPGNIFLGVGSCDIGLRTSVGVVAVSRADYEIHREDVERAIASAQAINLPPNRMILHTLVREYVVDGVRDIRDPLEMIGNRLEANSVIVDAFIPSVKSMTKCVEMLGGSIEGLVLTTLADARAVLTKDQRELGVALINIGAGKTGLSVYEEGKLVHTAFVPVGGGHITSDLAIGLKVPREVAEMVKLSFSAALPREVGARETVDLSKIESSLKGTASKRFIAEIVEARSREIFELVNKELRKADRAGKLPAGAVLIGGGAKMPGIVELA